MMARPTLFTHPKLRRLAHTLRLSAPAALGHLEYLWHVANESGEPTIGDSIDVELAAGWDGEPGAFTNAAAEVGFLDVNTDGIYTIHDYWHHAPEYVRKRRDREAERTKKYDGQYPPKSARHPAPAVSDRSVTGRCPENGAPPSPSPSPSPNKKKTLSADDGLGLGPFERFWAAYPRKVKRAKAQEAWDKLDPSPDLVAAIMTGLERAKRSKDWTKDNGDFIPHPTTWINGRRWEDEVTPADASDNRTEFEKAFDALPRVRPTQEQVAAVMGWDKHTTDNGQPEAVKP
jgi:hypothetical protein